MNPLAGLSDYLWNRLAWVLPRKLVYFAVIRATGHATTGKWGNEEAPAVKAMDVIERWDLGGNKR